MDWLAVALRLALYVDLGLAFGLPLFCLSALRRDEHAARFAAQCRAMALGCALAGIVLSLAALAVMARSMSGAQTYAALEREVFGMIVTGTAYGVAWSVRVAALVLCLPGVLALRARPAAQAVLLAALSAVALASLPWGGHGAMSEGIGHYVHLAADAAHLLAAGAWAGALAAFVLMSRTRPGSDPAVLALLSRTAKGFARIGTGIVLTLVLTGAVNYGFVIGPALPDMSATAYGGLLAAKLALFLGMLALAAANRFRHAPRLEQALRTGGQPAMAARALRRSVALEAAAGTAVLALVAMLGMLSPVPGQAG
ncbi:copper resistance protein D [Cupriavidus sp. TA19]|uniref:copper homeostasis membrane protein CopD n=1 Tax=unclassified Cupriavidus TaxID=2640874 RepID=UPI000E2F5A45|nr:MULTISPECIES: copper homeostasis membrane protein CopD [unclassified Cupriavidus]BDB28182.1 copper homeostasis membrane protein CopD [Cupriavidus sp. P-10]GLC94261.1 copper resistance protein D [Cupriavidus sp. TA19]